MAVISITITQSVEQIVSGIPKSVTLSTNVPAIIFYTLDGTTPTLFSNQYIEPIFLPVNKPSVTLSVFASNGIDTSPVIVEVYETDMVDGDARLSHAPTNVPPGFNLQGLYPFGNNPIQPQGIYGNPGDAGVTVDNPALPSAPTGFDGSGNPTGFTNEPYDLSNYNIVYSTKDAEGQQGPLVGNLPANVTVPNDLNPPPSLGPETTSQFTNTFDPRAFVIFQDFTKEDPNDPPQINRQFFSLEDAERARDGNYFFNSSLDSPPVNGSFLRSHYNPRTNQITYYYLDTWTNRWIISTTPYQPTGSFDGNLAQISFGRNGSGNGMVFEWLPFTRRVLF